MTLNVAQEYEENILMLEMKRRDGIGKLAAVLKLRVQVRVQRTRKQLLTGAAHVLHGY